jgi:hypothetical protein
MRFARSMLFVGAAIVGGLAGCEQQQTTTAEVPATPAVPAAKDSRSFMVQVVQPPTQVLWNYGYAEKMTDENWDEVSKAATALVAAMPTITAGGFSADEKARASQGGWQDWAKKTTDFVNAAKVAADQKNQMALATAGDSLVETCGGCHTEFDPNAQDPGAPK